VIYGADDRLELYQLPAGAPALAHARATVALVKKADLTTAAQSFKLPAETYGASMGLCADEPFFGQPNPAFCSGFLVAPDVVATAGHCLTSVSECEGVAFVFDFGYATASTDPTAVSAANVFYCKELLAHQAPSDGADFAVVKLDRAVTGRQPLAVRSNGKVADKAGLVLIGHPSGLPTKVAAGANVRSNDADGFFVANTDSYGGNSGSAVLNAETGVVEGILVRGERDFTSRGSCTVSYKCADDQCRGEDVTRATAFAALVGPPSPPPPPPPPPATTTKTHVYSALATAIPDNSTAGATKRLIVTQAGKLTAVGVKITIKHTYIGDLQVYLLHPDGTVVTLHDRTGGSKDDLVQAYGEAAATGVVRVAALGSLKTKTATGTWKVLVRDRAAIDVGRLDKVELTLTTTN
jgi:subtilisin-like proprotein convertase family protein